MEKTEKITCRNTIVAGFRIFLTLAFMAFASLYGAAQDMRSISDDGYIRDGGSTNDSKNFNKHKNDSTKEIPKGIYAWTVDRRYGDRTRVAVDTLMHLYPQSTLVYGRHGEYNTIGTNYSARINRIAFDRPETDHFFFTQPYDYVLLRPEQIHFTNTLSPITNLSYDNCGDKLDGEDHLRAKFAVNASKALGFGFDIDYSYARGYYQNQGIAHFTPTFYLSYIGDKYKMHVMYQHSHQKTTENGGITNDDYITHPETFDDQFQENEIPTVLEQNWNRNNHQHVFLTHRYSLGFNRKVKMTEEELKAKEFAKASAKDKERREKEAKEREREEKGDGDETISTTPDEVTELPKDTLEEGMKYEFVEVTSFIHTLEMDDHERYYQAYAAPTGFYKNEYYTRFEGEDYKPGHVKDQNNFFRLRNTFAIALLEGFNKYAKAGLKAFVSHDMRRYKMPGMLTTEDGVTQALLTSESENIISVGGQILKTQGKTLHYNLGFETALGGKEAGQMKVDFSTDLNFKLCGDTVTLGANAYLHRIQPVFFQRHYHSKNIWWDNDNLNKETRARIEGLFNFRKTGTTLRVAVEEIKDYTYFGMSYDYSTSSRANLTASVEQSSDYINLMMAQLQQNFRLGPLHWENVFTWQHSSDNTVLAVPDINVWTNLYLKFRIAKVLSVELGANATYFNKYYAPDYCPQINQFAVQQNEASRVKIGGYPFVDAYANMHLKHARFFLMFSHVNAGNGTKNYFLTPHYPQNSRVMHIGVSWNFFN